MLSRILIFLALGIFSLTISSCGDDDPADCTAQSFNTAQNAALDDVNNAGAVWANDPTQSNCDKLKDAANDYIDAIEDLEGCAGISNADYQAALQAARDVANGIC